MAFTACFLSGEVPLVTVTGTWRELWLTPPSGRTGTAARLHCWVTRFRLCHHGSWQSTKEARQMEVKKDRVGATGCSPALCAPLQPC